LIDTVEVSTKTAPHLFTAPKVLLVASAKISISKTQLQLIEVEVPIAAELASDTPISVLVIPLAGPLVAVKLPS
jgi:hypothetical protein